MPGELPSAGAVAVTNRVCYNRGSALITGAVNYQPAPGRPAGVLIGFASEDDWYDYRPENAPRFLRRIDDARTSLRKGRGVSIEDLE